MGLWRGSDDGLWGGCLSLCLSLYKISLSLGSSHSNMAYIKRGRTVGLSPGNIYTPLYSRENRLSTLSQGSLCTCLLSSLTGMVNWEAGDGGALENSGAVENDLSLSLSLLPLSSINFAILTAFSLCTAHSLSTHKTFGRPVGWGGGEDHLPVGRPLSSLLVNTGGPHSVPHLMAVMTPSSSLLCRGGGGGIHLGELVCIPR